MAKEITQETRDRLNESISVHRGARAMFQAIEGCEFKKYQRLWESFFDEFKDLPDFWCSPAFSWRLKAGRKKMAWEPPYREESERLYREGERHFIVLGNEQRLQQFYQSGCHQMLLNTNYVRAARYADAFAACCTNTSTEFSVGDHKNTADALYFVGRYDEAIPHCDWLIEHFDEDSSHHADREALLKYEAMRVRACMLREHQEAKILLGAPLELITSEKPPEPKKPKPDTKYGEWEFPDQKLQAALYHMRTRRDLTARQQQALREVFAGRLKERKRSISFAKARNMFAKAFHPNQQDAEILAILSTSERQDAWLRLNYYMGFSKKAHPVEKYRMSA